MKKMKKFLKAILDTFALLFAGKGKLVDEAIEAEYVDLSGEGRDRYGR